MSLPFLILGLESSITPREENDSVLTDAYMIPPPPGTRSWGEGPEAHGPARHRQRFPVGQWVKGAVLV